MVNPVLDTASAAAAVRVLVANPGSLVTSRGPQWVEEDAARAMLADAAISFLVDGDAAVVLAERMQTPGHFRLSVAVADDDSITAAVLDVALRDVSAFLVASVDTVRIDLVFGVYNERFVEWALAAEGVRFEGVLSDAFYAGGRHWEGVIAAITGDDLDEFRSGGAASRERRIVDRLRDRIREDLRRHGAEVPG
ncbi:hypothetical protein [Tsukamurella sp. 1534]|uniref:hypothetical protein n=1 Tax=Tsukamurella sp. 1534 TaxID=1151061 RepID=UPI0005941FBA|nr:hypothetical protein [Tsukamurella sp. 1534]